MSHKSEQTADTAAIDTPPPLPSLTTPPEMPSNSLLTVSSSSGYSTSDEVAARPAPKSAKRKTRAPATPNSPQLKRIRVDAVECASAPSAVVSAKPPLPPQARSTAHKRNAAAAASVAVGTSTTTGGIKSATGHKRAQGEQHTVVNKLNAYADQCRAEIGELKVALANEKAAVRTLR